MPVAVEQQLDLPGFPLMELIGVVYHNGRSFSSGHYTCLCRGPGGRFWSYDDTMPVHREDRDISHIKPKQVVLAVYGRGDGSATLAQVAAEAAEVAVVGIDEPVAVLGAEPHNVPSSSGGLSARRLCRKTSCEVPAPVQEVRVGGDHAPDHLVQVDEPWVGVLRDVAVLIEWCMVIPWKIRKESSP
mgnify:CR=1 FL=1